MTDKLITAVVLTHNSAKTLSRCLTSLTWCPQILVIDDNSTDDTRKIARHYGARIVIHPHTDNWAAQRNLAIKYASAPWLLYVDSDEEVSPSLKEQILHTLPRTRHSGFYLRRLDYFLDHPLRHGETAAVKLLRLAKKDAGTWARPVHEIWQVTGSVGLLSHPLIHRRRFTIDELIDRFNRYSDIDAAAHIKEGKTYRHWHLLKPLAKFFHSYVYLLGFLDGLPGLYFALLMSYYSLCLRVKLWEKNPS